MISDFNADLENIEDMLTLGEVAKKYHKQLTWCENFKKEINDIEKQKEVEMLNRRALEQEKIVKKRLEKMRQKYAYQLELF